MQNCPRCRRDNLEHRRFCGGCGAGLTAACRSCSFANGPDDQFCGGCGQALGAAGATAAARASDQAPAPVADQGLGQLLSEIQAEKEALAGEDKYFEQDELESLFDEDSEPKP